MAAGAERVGSQGRGKGLIGFRYGWGLNRRWSRRRLSSPGSPRGRPPRWFSLSSRRCRIKFRLTPLKPNIARIQVLAGCRLQGDLHGHNTDEAHGSANERLVKVGHWHQPITGLQRSTERQFGTFCQSCDGDSFSARTVCNRDAEWQWLTSNAFLVFDSEMCRRTQWFIRPRLSIDFRIGSGKANSAIPIMPITTAMTLVANSLPSLTLTELRSIAHDLYCSVRDGGRMMSGFSLFGSRTSLKGGVLSAVAGRSMLKSPSPRAVGRAAIWASDSSAQAGSAC